MRTTLSSLSVVVGLVLLSCIAAPRAAFAFQQREGDLAYCSTLDGSVHIARADGSDAGSIGMYGQVARWSPDGHDLAVYDDPYDYGDYDTNSHLAIGDPDSGERFWLESSDDIDYSHGDFCWDESGSNILEYYDMSGDPTVPETWWFTPAQPNGAYRANTGIFSAYNMNTYIRATSPMSDGTYAAAVGTYQIDLARNPSHYYRAYAPMRIQIIESVGGTRRTMPATFVDIGSLDVSRDGTKIVFSAAQSWDYLDIYQWDLRTNKVTELYDGPGDWNDEPRFTPDGDRVIWTKRTSQDDMSADVWSVQADGSNPGLFIANAEGADPRPWPYEPQPYGWPVQNGYDANTSHAWAIWESVYGPWSWMQFDLKTDDQMFEHGLCYGMAASSANSYLSGGDVSQFGIFSRSPFFGLWSLSLSTPPTDKNGTPAFTNWNTAARDCIERFHVLQFGTTQHQGTLSTLNELTNRIDNGAAPIVMTLHYGNEGHALVPYGYVRRTPGQTDVYVYDCNYPAPSNGVAANRVVYIYDNGSWAYDFGDSSNPWMWSGADNSMSWYDSLDINGRASGIHPQVASTAAVSTDFPFGLSTDGAYALLTDTSGHRLGYVSPGAAIVNEITGAQARYPDAAGGSSVISSFDLTSLSAAHVTLTPLLTGPAGMQLHDSDSAIAAEIQGTQGVTDRVDVDTALDQVSVTPASGTRTVDLWAGSSASTGSVMFGALDATTTGGDCVLTAFTNRARLQNKSTAPKRLTVAAIGAGWVGRVSQTITLPAGATVELSVGQPTDVSQGALEVATVTAGIAGGPTPVASTPYGTMGLQMALWPQAPVAYLQSVTISVRVAADVALASVRLQTSTDGVRWSDAGAFTSSDGDGVLSKSMRFSNNIYVRAVMPGTLNLNASVSDAELVPVYASLSLSAPSSVRKNHSFAVSGYLSPRHPSHSKAVQLQLFLWQHNTWIAQKTTWLRVSNSGSRSRFKTTVTLKTKGHWRIVAAHADASHAASTSASRYVTVK